MTRKNYDNIRIEQNEDIIFTTVGKYKMFLSAGGDGMDAYLLYSHLMFTARLQHTNSVKADDIYLKNGLQWGSVKLKKIKALLHKMNLIEYKQVRKGDGKLAEKYIIVHATGGTDFVPNPTGGIDSRPPVDCTYGAEQQMLKQTSKCLNKKHPDFQPVIKIFYPIDSEYKFIPKEGVFINYMLDKYTIDQISNTITILKRLKTDDKFWMKLPVIPSVVYSNWERINEAGKVKDDYSWCD